MRIDLAQFLGGMLDRLELAGKLVLALRTHRCRDELLQLMVTPGQGVERSLEARNLFLRAGDRRADFLFAPEKLWNLLRERGLDRAIPIEPRDERSMLRQALCGGIEPASRS